MFYSHSLINLIITRGPKGQNKSHAVRIPLLGKFGDLALLLGNSSEMTRLSIYILLLGIYVEDNGGQQPFTARLLYFSRKLGFGPLGITSMVGEFCSVLIGVFPVTPPHSGQL